MTKIINGLEEKDCLSIGDTTREGTKENATLDHYIPQSKDGKNTKENLRTCCLVCNGIKSGKTFEEAAPHILKSIRKRRKRKINI